MTIKYAQNWKDIVYISIDLNIVSLALIGWKIIFDQSELSF